MTHSLHRRGTLESLKRDFLVLSCSAKGYNDHVFAERCRQFLRICLKHNPVNLGDMKTGNILDLDPRSIIAKVQDTTIVQAVFRHRQDVVEVIRELKEADLGISVVISGLHEEVDAIVEEAGLERVHTREYSLGTHGRLELLPADDIMEFTTMCGHAMVAAELVRQMIGKVRLGSLSAREAAVTMAKCCSCGNFNVPRAEELLQRVAPRWLVDYPVY